MTGRGLIVAAPSSGSGKTIVTLGLLRALARRGIPVSAAKSGPDYIDPRFHHAATGRPCGNLDAWAMTPDAIRARACCDGVRIIEGAMGLFDGAPPDGRGSVADLARMLGLPVVLVVDATRMAQSIAPLVAGFAGHDPDVRIVGVIANRVGSDRHAAMLARALAPTGIPLLGCLRRDEALSLPSRHLGLVQASEHPGLPAFLDNAADRVALAVDLDALLARATPLPPAPALPIPAAPERIALAQDAAFAFAYPHQLAEWRAGGARILPFSPLADDPVPPADLIFLPGGYPEMHGATLANATTFLAGLRAAAATTRIYGECGGYMVLGAGLTDADGIRHEMAGLLDLETSFAARKLHLGYRMLDDGVARYAGHEFHYATTLHAGGCPLFRAEDAEGNALPPMGLRNGNVSGSFAHIIDRAP